MAVRLALGASRAQILAAQRSELAVLGLVIAPIFEMSLRQSLIMSNGAWTIFFERPISATLLAISAVLLILSTAIVWVGLKLTGQRFGDVMRRS